ncbi:MAG: hypothetical protein HDR16_11125 [Lachnospiraceae bacterium]|nr:hypothetical protein [Lachnospiraceae bacterium]
MWNKLEKRYWIPGVLLLLWMGIFAFLNANCQSFWADEMASIGFIRNGLSLSEVLNTYLYAENNLPLYPMILYVVYRVMPYGEQFLLIPSIIFCMAGVVVLAMTTARLKGKRAGFLALCLGASSGILIWQAAWEIRCYGLAFFLSNLVLYSFVMKFLRGSKKDMVLWSVSLALFFWTHWFAFILLAFYGLVDLALVIGRKISWKQLICWVPGCLLYFPWLLASLYYKNSGLENYWSEPPGFKNMAWTVLFYLDGNRLLWYLCLLTGAGLLVSAVIWFGKPASEEKTVGLLSAFCVAAVVWMIGSVFVYSRYLYPSGGLYVERYFTVIQPHILLITALGLAFILDTADKAVCVERPKGKLIFRLAGWGMRIGVVVLLLFFFLNAYRNQYVAIRKPFEPYREAADYLVQEEGIWEESSLFTGSNRFCGLDGFIHYYFEKRGYEPPENIVGSMVLSPQETRFYPDYSSLTEEELLSYDRIYCLRIHMGMDEALQDFLEAHYRQVEKRGDYGIEIWERNDVKK